LYPTLCDRIIEIKTSRPLYHFVLFFFSFPFGLPILATLLGELLELELGNVNKKIQFFKIYIYIYMEILHQILLDLNMQQNKNSQVPKL
jgi:hypothetical protein